MIPQIGQTISADEFNKLPEVGETISAEQFESLPTGEATPPTQGGFMGGVKNVLGGIGGYLKSSYEKATQPGGSLSIHKEGYITPTGPVTKEEAVKGLDVKKVAGLALGFGPSPLKDITVAPFKAGLLRQSSEKQYSQALAPTTKATKAMTAKVVPGLLEKKTFAFTRPGLEAKFHEELGKAGEKLDEVLETIPKGDKSPTKPILEALKNYKKAFYVSEGGKRVIVDDVGYKNAEQMESLVKEFGDDVSFGTIRKVRQILDTAVTKGGKAFGRTVSEGSLVDAQREASNAIRAELAEKYPDLAKVNAEYTFWKKAHDIIRATIERTQGQGTPLGETVAEVAGGAAGLTSGIGKAVTGALAFKWIKQITSSTGFRTGSAILKNEVADLIAKGKFDTAMELVRRGVVMGINKIRD